MPFQSEKQRRYLWANEPEIARDWTDTYGSGIAKAQGGRIGYKEGEKVDSVKHVIMLKQMDKLRKMIAAGLDADGKLQARLDQYEATPTTGLGTGPELKDPVAEDKAKKEVGKTQQELTEELANTLYGTGGRYGDKITEPGLAQLMKKDPLYGSYDVVNNMDLAKSFAKDPYLPEDPFDREQQLLEDAGTFGYTRPQTSEDIFIRDLNKFTDQPDINNPNTMGNIYETNKRIADVIGHESRHQLLGKPRFADIRERFESDLSQIPMDDREEVFNRILDLKSGQLRGQLEGDETGLRSMKGDYRDMDMIDWILQGKKDQSELAGTENIPMMGTAYNAMQRLNPLANEFIQRAQSGITSAAPMGGPHKGMQIPQYGIAQQPPAKQNWLARFKKHAMPAYNFMKGNVSAGLMGVVNPLAGLAMFAGGKNLKDSRFYRPATQGAYGRTPAQLNRMNALGGYYSEPARQQRRTEGRVQNMLTRREEGKSYSQKNLEALTGRDESRGSYTATPTRSAPAAAAQGIDVGATGMMGPGGRHYNIGGLASLWPR